MAGIDDIRNNINNLEDDNVKNAINSIRSGELYGYTPDVKVALDSFNKEKPKREIKGVKKDKKRYTGKEIRKKIGAIALSLAILAGVGTGIAKGIENSQETTKIVEQYDGDVDKMKDAIEGMITSEFEKTLKEENLSVDISRTQIGSESVGNNIKVKKENGDILVNVSRKHDLRGGTDYGSNESEKLGSIADEYLSLEDNNPRKAAKLLKKVQKFSKERNVKVTKVLGTEEIETIVDDEPER